MEKEKSCSRCNGRGVIYDDGYRANDCVMPSGYFKCPCCNGHGVIIRDQYEKDFRGKYED